MKYLPWVVLLALVLPVEACTAPPPTAAEMAAADFGKAPDMGTIKPLAEEFVRSRLKDPSSAEFRWVVEIPTATWFDGSKRVFCWGTKAMVNAKNSYGGYVGEAMWEFFWRGDRMIGYGAPYRGSGGVVTTLYYTR